MKTTKNGKQGRDRATTVHLHVVGWAMEPHLKTELVLNALDLALAQRRPEAVTHRSDRGCQYTSSF